MIENNEKKKHKYKTLFRNLDRSVKIINEFSEFLKLLDLREVSILKAMMVRFMIESTTSDAGALIEVSENGFEFSEVFQYRGNRIVDKDFSPVVESISKDSPEYSMIETTMKREIPTLFSGNEVKNSLLGSIIGIIPEIIIFVPVIVNDKVEYLVELIKKNKNNRILFSEDDIQSLSIISNIASAIFTNAELFNKAIHDSLTGLYNIHYFKNLIYEEMVKVKKFKNRFSLAIIDLDHFKHINDTYGHSVGDVALKFFSGVIKQEIKRSSDIIARYGGDEFIVAFPSTDVNGAYLLCSRLKERLNSESLKVNDKVSLIITPSIGIAELTESDISISSDPNDLFRRLFVKADTALYNSKKTGRNRITVYSDDLPLIEEREV